MIRAGHRIPCGLDRLGHPAPGPTPPSPQLAKPAAVKLVFDATVAGDQMSGTVEFGMYGMVQLTVQGRDCFVEVAEVPDDCPVLIGQIPLESLDFVVDPVNQRLIGNPEHGGEHMFDMF